MSTTAKMSCIVHANFPGLDLIYELQCKTLFIQDQSTEISIFGLINCHASCSTANKHTALYSQQNEVAK